jgi:hypothetical protein
MSKLIVNYKRGYGGYIVLAGHYVAIIKLPWHKKTLAEFSLEDYYYNFLIFRVHFCTMPEGS